MIVQDCSIYHFVLVWDKLYHQTQTDFTVSSMCQVVDGSTGSIRSFLGFFEPKELQKSRKKMSRKPM